MGLMVCLCSIKAFGGEVSRAPASYIPDDDVIVKPVDNEITFYERFVLADKDNVDVVKSRNQIKVWQDNQTFADTYGLDSSLTGSGFYVPTQDVKFDYFKNKYMRFLRAKGEQPLKSAPQNFYQDIRATNEVDTIDEMEARFKKSNKSALSRQQLPKAFQEREVSITKKMKMIFQPRVDQGLVIVGFKTDTVYARAWAGVNGKTELNIQQNYQSIGLRLMYNHYLDTGKYFTSIDQRLANNLYARATFNKDPQRIKVTSKSGEDNSLMLLYATQF